jgi:Flp pilus assembly protein TadD
LALVEDQDAPEAVTRSGAEKGRGVDFLYGLVDAGKPPTKAAPQSKRTAEERKDPPVSIATARAQIAEKRFDDAGVTLEKVLALAPDDTEAVTTLGVVRVLQARAHDGLTLLNSALTMAPFEPLPLQMRAVALGVVGQYAQALRDCDAGLKALPFDVRFLLIKANLLMAIGRLKEASDICETVIGSDQSQAIAYVLRGNYRRAVADIKGATEDYARAATLQAASR